MRIIGGNLKGKEILFLKTVKTRPLRDMVRESIFNVIFHSPLINVKIKNSRILDIYSGVGSFGIECISREAKNVTFIENDKSALEILKKNFSQLSINKEAILIDQTVDLFLRQINLSNKFDIIFLDPPFAENRYIDELEKVYKLKAYNKNHLIVIHREKNTFENLTKIIKTLIVKEYGRSKIIFGVFN